MDMNGTMTYEELRQTVFDYFKNTKDMDLLSTSIDYLKIKLTGSKQYDGGPFFAAMDELGEARFDLSSEDIKNILSQTFADKGIELTGVTYGSVVAYTGKENPNIKETLERVNVEPDITYSGQIDYNKLRKIILDNYKKEKGIDLTTTSIEYLQEKLRENKDNDPLLIPKLDASQPFFFNGEEAVDISKEEIKQILGSYFESKGDNLQSVNYESSIIKYNYKKNASLQKENIVSPSSISYTDMTNGTSEMGGIAMEVDTTAYKYPGNGYIAKTFSPAIHTESMSYPYHENHDAIDLEVQNINTGEKSTLRYEAEDTISEDEAAKFNAMLSQQADTMVNQMTQGVDVLGENQNQQEVSNGKQMGFTAIWLLGLVTGIVSAGILILGAVLLK